MDRVVSLAETVHQVVAEYQSYSPMAIMHAVHDPAEGIDLVIVIPNDRTIEPHVVAMTRLDQEKVLVEIDTTDHPLAEALIGAGIPRSQIVLAYVGETAQTI